MKEVKGAEDGVLGDVAGGEQGEQEGEDKDEQEEGGGGQLSDHLAGKQVPVHSSQVQSLVMTGQVFLSISPSSALLLGAPCGSYENTQLALGFCEESREGEERTK